MINIGGIIGFYIFLCITYEIIINKGYKNKPGLSECVRLK